LPTIGREAVMGSEGSAGLIHRGARFTAAARQIACKQGSYACGRSGDADATSIEAVVRDTPSAEAAMRMRPR